MRHPGLLTALTLAWYLALVAWVGPVSRPEPLVLVRPIALASPSEPLDLAVNVLKAADRLYAAQIGYAGQHPPEALAWQVIARSNVADSVFKLLAEFPNRPTQLYALAGVHRTDAAAYRELAARQRALGGSVATVVGCIVSTVPINPLVDQLDRGEWTTELLMGRLITTRPADERAAV
jgi:hypothetical protein